MTGVSRQLITRKIDAMSRRKHATRRNPGEHLTDRRREILGTAWNQHADRCARMLLRHFARVRNVPFATWQREFRAETYYTRAYASYEKGSVENCNRLVRRWYPKGTDFNRLTRRQIRQLEDWINSIHGESPDGETAYACDSRLAKVA